MKNFFSIVIYSVKENLKTKFYIVLLLFTTVLIFISLLLTGLSGFEQPYRVLVNSGIVLIEMFCLALILLNSVNLFLQEVETKSIYIILSKPISRTKYIISKYIGLLVLTIVNILITSIIHLCLIKISKWNVNYYIYLLTLITIFLKTGLTASISLLTTVVMTSQTAAVVTCILLWVAGHFTTEFLFIIKKIKILFLKVFFNIVYYLIPNFQYFNIKDYYDSEFFIQKFDIWTGLLYWLAYITVVLFFTCIVFKKKNL